MRTQKSNADSQPNGELSSSVFSEDEADSILFGDVSLEIGQGLLRGAALNSNVTLEQEMSLKAIKALIDQMSVNVATAQAAGAGDANAIAKANLDIAGVKRTTT